MNLTQMRGLYQNPLFNMGMNVLANNKGSSLAPVAQGYQQSREQFQGDQQQALLDQYRQMQMMDLARKLQAPPERPTVEVGGIPYYTDTQEPVIPGAQGEPDYKERTLPLRDGMEQKQFSQDGGKTWQNFGAPRTRSTGVTVNTGEGMKVSDLMRFRNAEGQLPPGPMSAEELRAGGYTLQDKPSTESIKNAYISDALNASSVNVDRILNNPDFNPASLKEYAGRFSNFLSTDSGRRFRAAADEWATNMVFLRSGATARQEEKDSAMRNFFPAPGDDPKTIQFKRKFRLQQENAAYARAAQSGRASAEQAQKRIDENNQKIQQIDAQLQGGGAEIEKTVNGVTYIKQNGKWYEK